MKKYLALFLFLLISEAQAFDMMQARAVMQDITVRLSAEPDGKVLLWLKGCYTFSAGGSTQCDCYKVDIKNTVQIDTIMQNKIITAMNTGQPIYSRDWPLFDFIYNKWLPTIPISLRDPWCRQ